MAVALLDANVLIALFWPKHQLFERAQTWFRRNADAGWATCPFTQAAFVRIVSNPALSPMAVSTNEAIDLLSKNLAHRHHTFWPVDIPFTKAIAPFANRIANHKQVTDSYLLGLAHAKRGVLVTMDQGLRQLAETVPELRGLLVRI